MKIKVTENYEGLLYYPVGSIHTVKDVEELYELKECGIEARIIEE